MNEEKKSKFSFSDLIKKLFYKDALTAEMACRISRYGYATRNYDFSKIVKLKIEEVDTQITNKLQFSNREKLLALLVPEDQIELYNEIKKYYDSNGFKTFYADKTNLPELGENRYLFLSWDI